MNLQTNKKGVIVLGGHGKLSRCQDHFRGLKNIFLIEPLKYDQIVSLMYESCCILTDSGGIQEEAPSLGKPVLVMRNVTECPEGINANVVRLVGTNTNKIIENVSRLFLDNEYKNFTKIKNLYGNGQASSRIVKHLLEYF